MFLRLVLIVLLSLPLATTSMARKYHHKHHHKLVRYSPKLIKKYLKQLERYDRNQLEFLRLAYRMGKKYNLGYTLMAVAMQESDAGKYMISVTGDYGLCGINLKYYLINHKIHNTYYKRLEIATKLIRNDLLNIRSAIEELRYWIKRYGHNYIKVWGSYNGGTIPNYRYANKILNRIVALRRYIKKHPNFLK